jgi:hypothetical protein
MANTNGKMEDAIMDSINMIKSMDLELIHGLMVVNMQESGLTVNDMDVAKLFQLMELKEKVSGSKIVDYDGLIKLILL